MSRLALAVLIAAACGNSKQPPPSSKAAERGALSYDHVVAKFTDEEHFTLELGLVGSDGTPVTAFQDPVSIDVELDDVPHAKLDSVPADQNGVLCNGTSEMLTASNADPATKRWKPRVELSSLMLGHREISCGRALHDANYHGPIYIHLGTMSGPLPDYEIQSESSKLLPDLANPKLPALDAELGKLKDAVGKLTAADTFAACTGELVGGSALETIGAGELVSGEADFDGPPQTYLFSRLLDYAHGRDTQPDVTLSILDRQARLGVYQLTRFRRPAVDKGALVPGVYDGRLVVFDRATAAPVCALAIHAESSSNVEFTKTVDQTGRTTSSSAESAVDHDFRDNLSRAIATAFAAFPSACPKSP